MKTTYNKTQWVDNSTPVNAENLNNIENGISGLYSNALGLSELIEGDGIEIKNTENGVSFGLNLSEIDTMPESSDSRGNVGDFYMDGEYFYFCITPDRWIKFRIDENF